MLCAEDDPDDRMLMRDAIAECDFLDGVQFVDDGADLLAYLRRQGSYADPERSPRPGIVVLDLNMPRVDGREALRQIKGDPDLRSIPVVILTTSSAPSDIATTYQFGASSFITKPSSYSELVNVVAELRRYWFETVRLPSETVA